MDKVKRKAGKIGGARRAEVLSPTRRLEIARQAASARWGIDVECYVLDDFEKTAVISQRGMSQALGMTSRGNALPRFLSTKVMSERLGAELWKKIENPIKFQSSSLGAGPIIHGFDVTILIDICNSIIAAEAEGKLSELRYRNIAKQAHIIVGASAKAGIKYLVYAPAGYNPTAEEVITAFKTYVQEEARKYEPEFPNELYLANPSGEVVEVILTTRIERQLTPVVVKLSRQQASDLAALLTLAKGG